MDAGHWSGVLDLQSKAYGEVVSIIGEEGIRQAFSPIEAPSGLPNAAYCSDDWLKLENEHIFARNWFFAGTSGEVPETGDIKPVTVAGTPAILVRDGDGAIRGFHNVCRHRGTRLVASPCRKSAIVCPYHAWNFRLDGSIRSRPHFSAANKIERFDKDRHPELSLYPVRTEVWNGCVFVDLSGEAEPLERWLAPLLARTRAFDFSRIRWAGKQTYRFKSNWKLVLENWMEGYHVFAAHLRLISHAPMEVRWSGEWTDHVFYNDYVAPRLTDGRGEGSLPHFPDLGEEDLRRGMWFACFPNFAAEVYADQFVVLAPTAVSPEETTEELHFFVVGDEAAKSSRHEEGRAELMAMWHALNLEDVEILENLQQGRRSIAFDGSIMSPVWEMPAHQLSQKVICAIAGHRRATL